MYGKKRVINSVQAKKIVLISDIQLAYQLDNLAEQGYQT